MNLLTREVISLLNKEPEAGVYNNNIDLANLCQFFFNCSCRLSRLKGSMFLANSQIEWHWKNSDCDLKYRYPKGGIFEKGEIVNTR